MNDALLASKPAEPKTLSGRSGRTLAEQAYEAIKSDLLTGALPAGAALLTRDLLERYGCGISPLREALARLVGEHFLEAESHRGVRVPEPSVQDVDDVYCIRIALEREALALSIAHGDDVWESEIVAACHRLERAPLPGPGAPGVQVVAEWEARHRGFHSRLVAAAPAPRLLRLIDQMVDQTERYRAIRLTHIDKAVLSRDIIAEHRQLMTMAVARDPRCLDLLTDHLDQTRRVVISVLEGANPPDQPPAGSSARSGTRR